MLSYYVCTYLTLLEFKFRGLPAFCLFCLLLGLQCLAQCLEHKHSFINSHGMSKLWKSSLEWVHGGEQYKGIVKECSVVLSRQCVRKELLELLGVMRWWPRLFLPLMEVEENKPWDNVGNQKSPERNMDNLSVPQMSLKLLGSFLQRNYVFLPCLLKGRVNSL